MKVKKPAKVRKPPTEKDITLARRLGFLRQANRITLQSLADQHGTQRSNLSAFVTSGGQIRNIAYDKIDDILFDLGMFPDGTLRPVVHEWEVGADIAVPMVDLLVATDFQRARLMKLSSGMGGFLVALVTGNILVFASLDESALGSVESELGKVSEKVETVALSRAGDSEIQEIWRKRGNAPVIRKLLLSLLQN